MQASYTYPLSDEVTYKVYTEKPNYDLIEIKQVHGINIVSFELAKPEIKADGIYVLKSEIQNQKLNIAIKTADCLPIVVQGKLGYCLIHAGWRGLAAGILEQKILKSIEPTQAIIGPSISAHSYQVSEEFKKNFTSGANFEEKEGKTYFNLQKEAKSQLRKSFPSLITVDSEIDTYTNDQFHSYRRGKTSQRNWNMLEIRA